jgi:hypothetical protein
LLRHDLEGVWSFVCPRSIPKSDTPRTVPRVACRG